MTTCCCSCPCNDQRKPYGLDAAGQTVHIGDYVMATLPNIPATRRRRDLFPCVVLNIQKASFQLKYAGSDPQLRRWSKEPFLRWRPEVVKADISGYGRKLDDLDMHGGNDGPCSCCPKRYCFECDQG